MSTEPKFKEVGVDAYAHADVEGSRIVLLSVGKLTIITIQLDLDFMAINAYGNLKRIS